LNVNILKIEINIYKKLNSFLYLEKIFPKLLLEKNNYCDFKKYLLLKQIN